MKKSLQLIFTCLIFISFFSEVKATHIRAGEITARLISCQNFTYEFTLTGYTDLSSDVQFGGGTINYGDGVTGEFTPGQYDYEKDLGDEIAIKVFYREHTFPGPGIYKISYREFNRNPDIVNMDNSVNTPFYIETVIIIDPFLGCNNTPVLLNPPIDDACIGVAFIHNAGAVDADGDSLSYEFTIPKQDLDIPVLNYTFPDEQDRALYDAKTEDKKYPATFTLDQITGDLVWDAPGGEGEYNVAFRVVEWRKIEGEWYKLGYVTRDMQIIVTDCDNDPPEIEPPPDTCVVAGDILRQVIIATDPDNDPIELSSFGSVYEFNSSPASYSPFPVVAQPSPAKLNFSWQTDCSHVREREYQVRFKAVDQPDISQGRGPKLADFATWFIRVVGPPPEGLISEQGKGSKVNLSWDAYKCDNATKMQVWRRVDSFDFEPDHCELGMPDYAGYKLITTLDIDQTAFNDNDLEYGVTYCYRLVAVFQDPAGGESIVSEESCVMIEEFEGDFGSLITNVSVTETRLSDGEIFIKWTSPFDIDPSKYPPPYTYEVYRGDDFSSPQMELISGGQIIDTMFTDTGLNTLSNPYNYKIVVYDNDNDAIDTTASASSVRLYASPITGALEITWDAEVPWSNISQQYPTHLLYRDNIDPNDLEKFFLLESVNVSQSGFLYLDEGLEDTKEYCYFVTTSGTYGNEKIQAPLLNDSQIACAQPNDTISPCTPTEFLIVNVNLDSVCLDFLNTKPCDYSNYYNELNWEVNTDPQCDKDVRSYNIYFSESGDEGTFELIDNVINTAYIHDDLESFKGCYKISSVDRSGNESELTEAICNDNCPYYELPNVFTPNEDGINEKFQAFNIFDEKENIFKCPRFVKSVNFYVYDRNGKEVYNNLGAPEKSILINWDGNNNQGKPLPSAVYFYLAEVTFDVLEKDLQKAEFKGWVQILK